MHFRSNQNKNKSFKTATTTTISPPPFTKFTILQEMGSMHSTYYFLELHPTFAAFVLTNNFSTFAFYEHENKASKHQF